jgi:hypothetical protein
MGNFWIYICTIIYMVEDYTCKDHEQEYQVHVKGKLPFQLIQHLGRHTK